MKSWRPELRALLLRALFLLLGLFAGGAARAAEPASLASFFARPGLQAARLSPDGRSLAFLATPGDARQTLYLLDLGEREARPRVLAQFDDADVARVDWVGSELLLFFHFQEIKRDAEGRYATKREASEYGAYYDLVYAPYVAELTQADVELAPLVEGFRMRDIRYQSW